MYPTSRRFFETIPSPGAAVNPARAVGIDDDYGTLEPGKYANIVILNDELEIEKIFHHGCIVED